MKVKKDSKAAKRMFKRVANYTKHTMQSVKVQPRAVHRIKVSAPAIMTFFEKYLDLVEKHGFDEHHILSFDESFIDPGKLGICMRTVVSNTPESAKDEEKRDCGVVAVPSSQPHISWLQAAVANGAVLAPHVIFKVQTLTNDFFRYTSEKGRSILKACCNQDLSDVNTKAVFLPTSLPTVAGYSSGDHTGVTKVEIQQYLKLLVESLQMQNVKGKR